MQKISLILILLSTFVFTNALWPIYLYDDDSEEYEESEEYEDNYGADMGPGGGNNGVYLDQPIDEEGYGTITCYCQGSDPDLYQIGGNFQVAGGIELPGSFDDAGQFYPQGFEGQDISTLQQFKDACNNLFPVCQRVGGCWGDQSPN